MALTVHSNPADGPTSAGTDRPSRVLAALEKVNAAKGGGLPEPADKSASEVKPDSGSNGTAKPEVKTETADQLRQAIEVERATRDAKLAKQELEHLKGAEQARQKDWRRALANAGHNIEQVVMDYVGGGDDKKSDAPAGGQDPEVAALKRELAELKGSLQSSAKQYTRAQRLEALRALAQGAGDEYSGMLSLGAEDNYLSQIEALEAERGSQLGDVELKSTLGSLETKTRDVIKNQLKQLGNAPWAKQLMRELLTEIKEEIKEDQGPAASEGAPPRVDLMNSDASPATRQGRTIRSTAELKAEARKKAMESLERRKRGLS